MAPTLAWVRLRRPWAVWWAVFVALLGALAPTVSHALVAAGRIAPPLEICTAQGPQRVAPEAPLSLADSSTGQDSAVPIPHCPFCLHSTERCAPPPHPLAYLFQVPGGPQDVTVWQAFFYPNHVSWAPPPRGPPHTPA